MIQTEQEYRITQQRLAESARAMELEQKDMLREGYTPDEIQRGLAPMVSFHQSMAEELAQYEQTMLSK